MPDMGSSINAAREGGKFRTKAFESPAAAARKPILLPDLIETARVAAIAHDEVARTNSEPTGDPDIDRIGFRKRPYRTPRHTGG